MIFFKNFLSKKTPHIVYAAKVLLGTPDVNQTEIPVCLVGHIIEGKTLWVATIALTFG
jgi:hypothetical protein